MFIHELKKEEKMEQRDLGDYKIIRTIGQGSLGTVCLAEHRFMKKQYVLKILPEELSGEKNFIKRFEEEIADLTTLIHPNIVKIHNISEYNGQFFIVTDYIFDEFNETMNLAQYVLSLNKRLDEETVFSILHQIAEALDFAHTMKSNGKSFAHRNLKLNNILISKRKPKLELRLTDFGLSRIIGLGAVLTRTFKNMAEALKISNDLFSQKCGVDKYPNPPVESQKLIPLHASFLQNYAFMAPEQKRLDTVYPIDHKVDIYAFGILAYFLLMSELPEGIFEMPSNKGGFYYNWDSLIFSCLQNQPNKRPNNLVEALECVKHKTVLVETNIKSEIFDNEAEEELVGATAAKLKAEETQAMPKTMASATQLQPIFTTSQLERPKEDLDPGAIFQLESSVKSYQPEFKDVGNIKPILNEMIIIDGDSYYRGSQDGNRDEMPRHKIRLSNFAIDIHPVTNEQFVRFLEVMGGEKDSNHNDIIRLRDSRIKRSAGKLSIESGYAKHPVVGVTWYGAIAYSKWIGKRLPTEAEWEIAARGGREVYLYPTGADIEKSQANFFSADTTAVMSYAPNGYGLYDMAGNVYEWCHDWYGYNYYESSVQEPNQPQGPPQGVYRVLRGGCWKSLKEDLRCSRRHRNNPGTVNSTYGFRCAADVNVAAG